MTLDLSTFDDPGGKEKLAVQLFDAVNKIGQLWSRSALGLPVRHFRHHHADGVSGFFYVINFGLSQEQVDRQFSLCKQVFELSVEEKMKYRADLENGGYNGYKPFGIRDIKPGIKDNTEIYNVPKFIPEYDREHPQVVKDHWDEIEHFARHIHSQIVGKLLVLLAIVLELPEDYFLQNHRYDAKSDDHLRWMKYHKRTPEQNDALDNVWVKGHTDFGSLTLLFR